MKFDKELVQRIRIAKKVKAVVGNCMGVYGTVPFPMDWPEQKVTVVGEEFSAAGPAATVGLLHSVFGRVECRNAEATPRATLTLFVLNPYTPRLNVFAAPAVCPFLPGDFPMKAERRHELQENQLAAWLAEKYVDVRPYLTAAIVGVAALALAWAGWSWYSKSTATAQAETWNRFYKAVSDSSASDDTPLRDFIRDFPTDPAGIAARQRLAILLMSKGANGQLVSRDASRAAYQEAIENFAQVRRATDDESLKRFATLQIAIAHESRYDLDKALEEYQSVVKQWPGSAEAERAAVRIDELNNQATKDFYEWHRIANPAATTPTAPKVPIEPAKDLDKLPDAPPAEPMPPADATPPPATTPPATDGETKPADAPPADAKPTEEKPTDEKPAEEKPAEPPTADKPAAEQPPAEEKPAEPKPTDNQPAPPQN
ncbi:MAG: hypothetical protein DCC68_16885 [Planctomycetota bacterium]|nr:MAG: hypothetical protein DCC68_16885 [Planctomycetota bacterium]